MQILAFVGINRTLCSQPREILPEAAGNWWTEFSRGIVICSSTRIQSNGFNEYSDASAKGERHNSNDEQLLC